MLRLLHIENIAVIEEADITFDAGFNVLTGETGAGKSIIIDSIGAIMGQRTSRELIRNGAAKGFVSAVFSNISPALMSLLDELGLGDEDDKTTVMVQRELGHDGKNVCRINMRPVTTSVLKQVSPYLIHILGQHDSQNLLADEKHIEYLDHYCDHGAALEAYRVLFLNLKQLRQRLKRIEENRQEMAREAETLEAQLEEIALVDPVLGEDIQLEAKKAVFDNSVRIVQALDVAHGLVYGGDDYEGAYTNLCNVANTLAEITDVSDEMQALYQKAKELQFSLEDFSSDIAGIQGRIDFSDEQQDQVELRLEQIYRLKRKYGSTVEDILAFAEKAKARLDEVGISDDVFQQLHGEYKTLLEEAKARAHAISDERHRKAKELDSLISTQLDQLDMKKAAFQTNIETSAALSAQGVDKVSFLIATNAGETAKPLSKVASGGELSRISLAMKAITAQKELVGTMIFDEVDTGVSGRAANRIGEKLYLVSRQKQVLCVTHLAGIAALADIHFSIEKNVKNDKTYTQVTMLDYESRKNELARIISGDHISKVTLENAAELISNADTIKKDIGEK